MAFNIENLLPLFGSLANNAAIVNSSNYINQMRRDKTPEPPPAPKLSSPSPEQSRKVKPNQGTAPMDIENDDIDFEPSRQVPAVSKSAALDGSKAVNSCSEKLAATTALSMPEASLYLNGLLPAGTAGYMFFPTSSAAATATAASTMLMDPTATAMMAAAMQQMHQYPGFPMSTDASSSAGANGNGGAATADATSGVGTYPSSGLAVGTLKEVIKTKHCILFPPNPDAPPPTIRERPLGCRTVFVGGLPENITEEIIREIFESCGEITTLRMSKKNFCHIRYRTEAFIDRAIYLSGYRLRISDVNDPMNYGRLHVDYAQARDDQYDYECKQRQLLREQRHRERMTLDRSQSPPPIPHYTDHEASIVSEHLRNNDTFLKSVQTITVWLERGDCTKRNANAFYSMIQSTHAHVRRLYADKQLLEQDLRKARESYRKQMLTMSTQFTQIEKVFSAASHKKVWDHFTKAQRKNIDQWKKLASELRSVQIEDDEMEMSDDDRDSRCCSTKKARFDSESLKEENDSLRCQIDAMRNEMFMNRTELRHDSDFREKQIKVLQETIRNMQTQLLQTKMREQQDAKSIELLERELKEARVRTLLLHTKIKETMAKQKENKANCANAFAVTNAGEEPTSNSTSEKSEHKMDADVECGAIQAETELIQQPEESKVDIKETNDSQESCENDEVFIIVGSQQHHQEHVINIDEAKDTSSKAEIRKLEIDELDKDQGDNELTVQLTDVKHNKENLEPENSMNCEQLAKQTLSKMHTNEAAEEKSIPCTEHPKVEFKSLELCEAKIIVLAAAFLVIQPRGASSESICDYLNNVLKVGELKATSLDSVLSKYKNLFKSVDLTPSRHHDADVETKWIFCGFV